MVKFVHFLLTLSILLTGSVFALEPTDPVKINEVYYDATGTESQNEYIELYNASLNTTYYLDGAIISDNGGSGNEGVFKFPGNPGETAYPIGPGEFVLIAVSAVDDETPPELSNADWETYKEGGFDNPNVPNLVIVQGSNDLALNNNGDGIFLATGTDITLPIDGATVVDGVNYESPSDPVYVAPSTSDGGTSPFPNCGVRRSLGRYPDGTDTNNSDNDLHTLIGLSPGEPNYAVFVESTTWGKIKAIFSIPPNRRI